jgi:hypothetical protein
LVYPGKSTQSSSLEHKLDIKVQNHWWGKGQGLVGNLRGLVGNFSPVHMLKNALLLCVIPPGTSIKDVAFFENSVTNRVSESLTCLVHAAMKLPILLL